MTSGIVLGWESERAPPERMGFHFPPSNSTKLRPKRAGLVCDRSDGHVLVVAPTGAGKSRSIAIPNLLHWNGTAIVLDVKGELTETTQHFRERHLGHQIIRLDPWGITTKNGHRLNPFDRLRRPGAAIADECYGLADVLEDPNSAPRDSFWVDKAKNLVAGLIGYHTFCGEDGSFRSVWNTMHSYQIVSDIAHALDKKSPSLPPSAYGALATFINTTETTRSGIGTTAENLVRVFGSDCVQQAVEASDFDLGAVKRGEPLTIYLVIPPAKLLTHAPLVRLWLAVLLGELTDRSTRPRLPTLLVLDEIAQFGPLNQLRTIMTLARSYGVRAMLFVQSLEQLRYSYRDATSLIENASTIVTFGHTKRTMSVTMAELFGDVSADALYCMEADTLAMKTAGQETRFLRKCDYLTDTLFLGRGRDNPLFRKGA